MNRKFKLGDSIRCIDVQSNSRYLTKGKIYTVLSYDSDLDTVCVIADDNTSHNFFPYRFELVEQDALDVLIARANDGMRAIEQLVKYHDHELETDHKDFTKVSSWFEPIQPTFRRKAPPLPAPFTLKDSLHSVQCIDASTVKVGCQTFRFDQLRQGLFLLIREDCSEYSSIEGPYNLSASKRGVSYGGNSITWADAEQLLAALEQVKP